jgi:hypothetical protein
MERIDLGASSWKTPTAGTGKVRMQRTIILVLAVLVLLLGGALAYVLLRGPPGAVPVSIEAGAAPNPYRAEMECIDRVLQRHDMDSNQVQPAMDDCRASGQPGNRSAGQ